MFISEIFGRIILSINWGLRLSESGFESSRQSEILIHKPGAAELLLKGGGAPKTGHFLEKEKKGHLKRECQSEII